MKTDERTFTVSAISLAIRSALALMCVAPLVARAQDAGNDDLIALIFPVNYFDVGVLNVPTDSPTFFAYNGHNSSAASFLGNLDVLGCGA